MEEKVVLNIHYHPVIVHLIQAKHTAHRFSFTGGQIYMQVGRIYSLPEIQTWIEKAIPEKKIAKFVSDDYTGKDYIYLTGNKHRLVILNEGMERERMEDIVFRSRDEVEKKLREFALEIYTAEIRKYEKIMGIPVAHEVKVTSMSSALGKNYHSKQLITLDKTLIHYSVELIDSVVIHELCHYFHQNHSQAFYDLLYFYCPNYDECREKLTYGIRR